MKTLKNSGVATIYLLVALFFHACSPSLDKDISVTVENGYPVVSMPYFNHQLVLKPVDDETGSIGYLSDTSVVWLKGKPALISSTENKAIYKWKAHDINLTLSKIESNYNITLSSTNDAKPLKWYFNILAIEDEYFTGVFERVVDGHQNESWADGIETAMNLRGTKMDVKLKYTVSAYAPFYLSSANYGLYVKGTWPGVFDFCKSNPSIVTAEFEGPELNVKIYTSDNPMNIVEQHALESGPSIKLPEWGFGPWRWRDQHFNKAQYYDGSVKNAPYNTDLVEDVLMMEALDIPATAHWIDRPWGTGPHGYDDFKFDRIAFPDPEGMIKWLNGKNQEIMLWIGPYVMGDMYDYAIKHNYHLESNTWRNYRQALMDFTNEEAVKWWGDEGPGKLAKMGVKGFKLDRADGEKLRDDLHKVTNISTSYRENYNDYPRQYVKATYDAVKPVLGKDFVLFPRAQYNGSAKYGAMWAGDTDGKPEGLRSAIIAMLRCAVMGYPNWGSDVGGYWGDFSRETTLRWLGFGCFSPIMEVGPTNNLAFWSNPTQPFYDEELIAAWRLYSKVHYDLIPYIKKHSDIAHDKGTPIARPLFLDYPDQKEAWKDWQSYMFGPDILVSAIWQNKPLTHKLYLPAGDTWIDAWDSDNEIKGGQHITVIAPLYKIPVFIRKGSNINLGDLNKLYEESLKIAATRPKLKDLEAKEGWK